MGHLHAARRLTAVVAVIATCYTGSPARAGTSPTPLEGVWATTNGEQFRCADANAGIRWLSFHGEQVTIRYGYGAVAYASFSLDRSATPCTIDVVGDISRNEDFAFTYKGIYSCTEGRLTICWDRTGKKRPSTFEASGATQVCLSLSRFAWDTSRLVGKWRVKSSERSGAQYAEPVGDHWVFSNARDEYVDLDGIASATGGKGGRGARVAVDQFANPKRASVLVMQFGRDGLPSFSELPGIYCVDGNSLVCCFSETGQTRPSDFRTSRGDKRTLYCLQREVLEGKIGGHNTK
jgi:uncharacterized protein (TIGR03067 family)